MEFGVPKEVRALQSETRVGLTPAGVMGLVHAGHTVYVEKGAGVGAGFADELYRQYGAQVVYSAAEVYGRSDVVVKVSRPTADEHELFRAGQTIFSFLHLQVASSDLFEALCEREITAVAMETIEDERGWHPVLLPMSEVAGRLAPVVAGQLLMTTHGGRGTLLGGIPGVPRASVVIVGAGVLGANATRAFLGSGAEVIVADSDIERLEQIDKDFANRVTTLIATHHNLDRISRFADVLVGAIQDPGSRAEKIVSREMVKNMRSGSVILDFSINDGGCVETSHPTTLRDPVFVVDDVIHYCVPNLPAAVSRTTSYGLTNALLPYLKKLGQLGLEGILREDPGFAQGVHVYEGKLAHPEVAAALGREVTASIRQGGSA
ncbi:MAG: alanine dehydrogenase [Candidatus Promineifilaceae bacterium]